MKEKYLVIFGIFLGLGVLLYFILWGFSFPPCAEREKILEIPEYLKNVTIRFEHPMTYVWYSIDSAQSPKDMSCTNAGRVSVGFIEPARGSIKYTKETEIDSYGYKQEFISPDEDFKIIRRVDMMCPFLRCIGGGGGEEYLVQNEKGIIWRVFYLYFKNTDSEREEKPWNAGYYDSAGQRLGDVTIGANKPF